MRKYYLHQRHGTFYAELVDRKTGLKLTAQSTQKNRDDALLVVADCGVLVVPDRYLLCFA
ncbi:MAG: hypothetical protein Ta2B_13030 [Termitinemataceae bacterium]|nr:MAG: hypothetical protein Ta2B_13030 [Termitinemataceae bacterium]